MADGDDARREVEKMLPHLRGWTQTDVDVLTHYAKAVPLAGLVSVRDSLRRCGIVGVGYAVNALKIQARERNG